jgi:probable O-glycosylation ligase (exosortase A-associated)
MRGLLLGLVFFSLLPLIFTKGPFIGIVMWFWISLMAPQMIVWGGFFGTIPYALIVAVATLISWLLLSREPKRPPPGKTTVLIVLLMIWISITSSFGTGPPEQIFNNWQLAEKMLLMTVVAYTLTNSRERVDQLIVVCALSIAYYGLKGGVFTLLHGGAFRVQGPEGTMIGDNNTLGVALTMILPLLFYLRQRYTQPYLKWSMLALIGFTVIGDLFTYSRGALIAIAAMVSVAWLRSRKKIWPALFAGIVAVGVWIYAPPQWIERMGTIQTYEQDESATSRLYFWQLSWAMALKRPVTGAGFHWSYDPQSVNQQLAGSDLPALTRPRAIHSIWFEMVGDHGFPGLALFLAILLSAAIDARWLVRCARQRPDLAWAGNLGRMLQASLIGFAAGGSFVSLAFYDGFYAIVIIAAAARRVVATELANEATPVEWGRALAITRSRNSLELQQIR